MVSPVVVVDVVPGSVLVEGSTGIVEPDVGSVLESVLEVSGPVMLVPDIEPWVGSSVVLASVLVPVVGSVAVGSVVTEVIV
jgi:hypothetical protein